MKALYILGLVMLALKCSADVEIPKVFGKAPISRLPISVGRSSYDGLVVSSSRYIEKYDIPQNEEYYDAMTELQKYILLGSRKDILSIKSELWEEDRRQSEMTKSWRITQLPEAVGLKSYLLGTLGGIWLIVAKNGLVSDFQLVNASRSAVDKKGNYIGRIASLDTTFGDGAIFQQLPITNFERTGIFCTEYVAGKYDEEFRLFKRRITPEGKIESKEIKGTYEDCKAPW